MPSPKLTIALYLSEDSPSLALCLKQLFKLNKNNVVVHVYIDSQSLELMATVETFFSSNKIKDFILFKNLNSLGASFCFNNSLDACKSKYILFMNFNSILADNFYEKISKLLDQNYDVISCDSVNHNFLHNLNSDNFQDISSELILGISNKEIYDKIFDVNFLKNNNIRFTVDKWYPDLFMLEVLLTFKKWENIKNVEIISFKKNIDINFNIYNLLFQIKLMDDLVTKYSLKDEYLSEIEYWYALIAKYKFLSRINAKYYISENSKMLNVKNNTIRKLAIQNSNKYINMFCSDLTKNKFYKDFKKIIDSSI